MSVSEIAASQVEAPEAQASIDPEETLFIPKRRRFSYQYIKSPEGKDELELYFGTKEILFDEPDLFSFGETLTKQDSFVARSATTWTSGAPYEWDRVKGLLETLVAEGVLVRGACPVARPGTESELHKTNLAIEEARVAPTQPLWWNPDCAKVMQELTGRPLELGYLEAVVSLHRVAHPALDGEGRHVGEMNVFPGGMRMKMPTEWKTCHYAGSRFQDDLPMNITALTAMRRWWRPLLRGVLEVREEFLRRHPSSFADGTWKMGDLHALACSVLALPALLLLRGDNPVVNGELDPVLSSMFRVTDGVRMVTAYALDLRDDNRRYDAPMTSAELLHITEGRNHFHSDRGVCAGPPLMVNEFFATLIDGKTPPGELPPPSPWVSEVPRAVDYALHGLQSYALVYGLWVRMGLAYDRIRTALQKEDPVANDAMDRLRERVEEDWKVIRPSHLHLPEQRAYSAVHYQDLFERAQPGIRGPSQRTQVQYPATYTPPPDVLGEGARQRLLTIFCARMGLEPATPILEDVVSAVHEYLRAERAVLPAVMAVQRNINELLGRPHPTRPLAGADLALNLSLRGGTSGELTYVMHAFRDVLGIEVANTAVATRLTYDSTSVELV